MVSSNNKTKDLQIMKKNYDLILHIKWHYKWIIMYL